MTAFRLICLLLIAGRISLVIAAEPVYPLTASADKSGAVYVSDLRLPGLWKVQDGQGEVYFQASSQFRTPLNAVRCVRVDRQGRVLACDSSTRDVYRINDQGQTQGLTNGRIGIPMDVVEQANGDLLVSDLESHRIWSVPADGGDPKEFAAVPAPRGMRLDAEGRLWVVSHGKDQILRFLSDGSREVAVPGRPFQFPHEILIRKDGTALVTDGYAKTVWKFAAGEAPVRWVQGEPLQNPVGLCLLEEVVLIVDPRAKSIFQADREGKLSVFWQGPAN